VLAATIRAQLDPEGWMFEQCEAIVAHLEKGFTQAERGELTDGDAVRPDRPRPIPPVIPSGGPTGPGGTLYYAKYFSAQNAMM